MKRNDSGDFCVLYVEPGDDRALLFAAISGQKKPIVMMVAEHAQVFQRPEDFSALKHLKRQLDLPVLFVIPGGHDRSVSTQMAARYGFPVYLSMDALANALVAGQLARQRSLNETRRTVPLEEARDQEGMPSSLPTGPRRDDPMRPGAPTFAGRAPATLSPPVLRPKKTVPLVSLAGPSLDANGRSPYAMLEKPYRKTGPLSGTLSQQDFYSGGSASSPRLVLSQPAETPPQVEQWKTPEPAVYPIARKKRRPASALIVLTIIGLLLAGLGSFLIISNKLPVSDATAATPVIVGHITFLSSEQLSENSSQGISDEVQIDLANLPNPAPHMAYYAWLLGDKNMSDTQSIALGQLTIVNGKGHLLYLGDTHHTNLLQITSRFLVTEEDIAVTPIAPTPDLSAWRYYGEFSQTPLPRSAGMAMSNMESTQTYSYLDHLRHLLAADPLLDQMELPGGLNSWFFTNTGKVLEWTGSTRGAWEEGRDIAFVRRQSVRVLAYLDGLSFVQQDLPPNTPLGINDRLAGIGLLQVNGANQDPPSYMAEIVHHLSGLLQASVSPADLRKSETDLLTAMSNVQLWLNQVRHDAQQIMKMSDQELQQPTTLALLNDMIDNANHAYVGQANPASGETRQGVIWIHEHMQSLALLPITPFTGNKSSIQMVPDNKHLSAMH
ncbi:MAG TPA: hypothetical protein VKR06_01905 [Ktedonosporobacter sp.]|nr:hypothetical protein [Ktedonosporobacter sp.]